MMEVQFSVKFRKQKTKLKMERRLRDSSWQRADGGKMQ
jgi:hypothetical protein